MNQIQKIKEIIGYGISRYRYDGFFRSMLAKDEDEKGYDVNSLKTHALSKEQKGEIARLWGCIIPGKHSRGYSFYEYTQSIDHFDARYLPSSYYYPHIIFSLSPLDYANAVDNKSMMPLLFQEFKQPENVLSTNGGGYFVGLQHISSSDAADLICSINADLVVKTSINSECGKGVEVFRVSELPSLAELLKTRKIHDRHPEFVIQKMLKQSPTLKQFNPTSLNCMRITTLNLNKSISVCSAGLKCGGIGQPMDNIGGAHGGMIVGIEKDGALKRTGYTLGGVTLREKSGIKFEGVMVPNYQRVVDMCFDMHSHFPEVKLIGWDIALDEADEPVLIEANAIWPGITFEQFASGPIFGNRTEEVIDYVRSHPAKFPR